jgi:hypothetical protein
LKFLPGNPGRPRGSKNKIAERVYADALEHWNSPVMPGHEQTKGKAALQMCFKLDPGRYLSFVGSLLPKEFLFEASMAEMDDQGIDDLIEHLRARLIEERSAAAVDITANVPALTNESKS